MPEYCDCYGIFVWPSGEPEDWEPAREQEDFAS
jgi:hypothetical protein